MRVRCVEARRKWAIRVGVVLIGTGVIILNNTVGCECSSVLIALIAVYILAMIDMIAPDCWYFE